VDQTIEYFINTHQVAVVGVSDKKFGGAIYKTLKQRGYTVHPVHPTRAAFEGDPCHPRLDTLPPEVKAAVIAVSPTAAEMVVTDAIRGGMTHLWFQQGADFARAESAARTAGIQTVSRRCILMYAPPVTGIHAFHRFVARLFGRV
jgi:predicted CoA-binding protein